MLKVPAITFGLEPAYHKDESSTSHHVQGVGMGEADVDRVWETVGDFEREGETVTVNEWEGDTVTVTEGVRVVVWEGELDAEWVTERDIVMEEDIVADEDGQSETDWDPQ